MKDSFETVFVSHPQLGINKAEFLLVVKAETKCIICPSFGWVFFLRISSSPSPDMLNGCPFKNAG